MSTPHPYYRPNPARAIHISGLIDRELLSKITPEILKLLAESREPITVYIDSPGGIVSVMEAILQMLKLPDQDYSDPCHIITAVTNRAASAAADLLSSGDYAVAYPHSTILYHGMRTQEGNPLTAESSSILSNLLRRSNDVYAIKLAHKIDDRFSLRFLFAQDNFPAIRQTSNDPNLSDLDCFIEFVNGKLSTEGRKVWKRVQDRHARYRRLFDAVSGNVRANPLGFATAQAEAAAIKAMIDFEARSNQDNPEWNFRDQGMSRIVDDFFLFNEYLVGSGEDRLAEWLSRWRWYVVPPEAVTNIEAIPDEHEQARELLEKGRPFIEPLASFFAALCHALQEGENDLTATDAYWLGLVDEVVGEDSLLCLRHFEEEDTDDATAEDEQHEKGAGDALPSTDSD